MARTGVGSFNVSVAAALALYEMRRQRGDTPPSE
jgi:tRNA G18 (ribose-2'-O)-methylase SpoU